MMEEEGNVKRASRNLRWRVAKDISLSSGGEGKSFTSSSLRMLVVIFFLSDSWAVWQICHIYNSHKLFGIVVVVGVVVRGAALCLGVSWALEWNFSSRMLSTHFYDALSFSLWASLLNGIVSAWLIKSYLSDFPFSRCFIRWKEEKF